MAIQNRASCARNWTEYRLCQLGVEAVCWRGVVDECSRTVLNPGSTMCFSVVSCATVMKGSHRGR